MSDRGMLFSAVDQIAFVVKDLYEAMDQFGACGLGPWEIMRFGDAGDGNRNIVSIENVVLHGEESGDYALLQSHCMLPGNTVELELIQPLRGRSVFAEYLETNGPGLQHVSICHGDYDEAVALVVESGHELSQIATVDTIETCVFSDYTDLYGTWLELHKRPEDFQKPDLEEEFYPADRSKPEKTQSFAEACEHLGIAEEPTAFTLCAIEEVCGPLPGFEALAF